MSTSIDLQFYSCSRSNASFDDWRKSMLTIIDPLLSETDWHVRGFDSFPNASLRLNASYQKKRTGANFIIVELIN